MASLSTGIAGVLLFALLFAGVVASPAQAGAGPRFRINDQEVEFKADEGASLLLSASCVKASGGYDCAAFRARRKASLRAVTSRLIGGANPGAVICRGLGAEVVNGRDSSGNENSFCRFSDGSMISSGSLVAAGLTNDRP